jgi:hypothetical protein
MRSSRIRANLVNHYDDTHANAMNKQNSQTDYFRYYGIIILWSKYISFLGKKTSLLTG